MTDTWQSKDLVKAGLYCDEQAFLCDAVRARMAKAALASRRPSEYAALHSHGQVATLAAAEPELEDAGWLQDRCPPHLPMEADCRAARAAFERALAVDAATYRPAQPTAAVDLPKLSYPPEELSDLQGAHRAAVCACTISKKLVAAGHPKGDSHGP